MEVSTQEKPLRIDHVFTASKIKALSALYLPRSALIKKPDVLLKKRSRYQTIKKIEALQTAEAPSRILILTKILPAYKSPTFKSTSHQQLSEKVVLLPWNKFRRSVETRLLFTTK